MIAVAPRPAVTKIILAYGTSDPAIVRLAESLGLRVVTVALPGPDVVYGYTPWYLVRPHGRCRNCNTQWRSDADVTDNGRACAACGGDPR